MMGEEEGKYEQPGSLEQADTLAEKLNLVLSRQHVIFSALEEINRQLGELVRRPAQSRDAILRVVLPLVVTLLVGLIALMTTFILLLINHILGPI